MTTNWQHYHCRHIAAPSPWGDESRCRCTWHKKVRFTDMMLSQLWSWPRLPASTPTTTRLLPTRSTGMFISYSIFNPCPRLRQRHHRPVRQFTQPVMRQLRDDHAMRGLPLRDFTNRTHFNWASMKQKLTSYGYRCNTNKVPHNKSLSVNAITKAA